VRQLAGTDYNVTAQTTLTFTTAPANGVGVDVYFLGLEVSIPTPADGTISEAKLADNAVTLAKMAGGTDGQIITYDASGDPVAVGPGTDGQVLTSTGAGSPPAFEDASGGAWAVKTSGTFSTASQVTFSGLTKTTKIVLPDIVTSTATQLKGRIGTGSTPTIITASHYSSDSQQFTAGSTNDTGMTRDHIALLSNVNGVSAEPGSVEVDLFVPENTSYYTNGRWISSAANAGHNIRTIVGAFRYGYQDTATTAVTAFQIFPASGTITGSYVVLELN
jgi:hypothetical protein